MAGRLAGKVALVPGAGGIGRVGRIDEVAMSLASDEASFVTGANYTVDGGLSVKGEQPQD